MDAFYTINTKEITGNNWNINLSLNADHPVYQGHFPEKAIAPGVMLTEMVKNIIEDEWQTKLKMKAARNIKFLNMMLPEEASSVDLILDVDREEEIKVKAEAKIGEDTYFKISATFE
ncbi:MAG: hypothetical protein MI810_00155 [Flavobacteriales bacterium]|jgi:3-hydroxyacyl-[acyl-carrier-protein] dehydratase|nr:hypothetical protein [Flavobacteriales bacterium]